ncbi:transketolase [Microbacterium fluvii]|uniref:Transketolase n=1 Tax=Microbacterium fluvii TaxID=415215 RepID=A0ABW2HDF9_9MICO|nr:transketolase [Microbacterium fluvii]MCU4672786.1 transketolase [Microbacterium fluvii]
MSIESATAAPTREELAAQVRRTVLLEAEIAGSGHYGPSLSCTDLLVALYTDLLRVDPADPDAAWRDRLVLSKGHACSALYAVLAQRGFFAADLLRTYTRLGTAFGDHPDMKKVPGVDFSAGALGHGLSVAVGMALHARLRADGARTVAILGDGELNEGQIWEAAGFAGANRLSGLVAIVDVNTVCVDGTTREVLDYEPLGDKWAAFGWEVERIDGHDFDAIDGALGRFAQRHSDGGRPTVILADTVAGKGVPPIEGMAEWHIGYLGGADLDAALLTVASTGGN